MNSKAFFAASDPQCVAELRSQSVDFARGGLKDGVFRISAQGLGGLVPLPGNLVTWGGYPMESEMLNRDARWRLSLGYAQRSGALLANYNLLWNTVLPLIYHGWLEEDEALATGREYLADAGFASEVDKLPAWCSSSASKAGLILRALIPQPQALLLDEPLIGLHPQAANALLTKIQFHQKHLGLRLVILGTEDGRWDTALDLKVVHL